MTLSFKRIAFSVAMLAFAGALIAGATGAFFNDTETSTGNTFSAGAIDLLIDNASYKTDANGVLVASPETSWAPSDLPAVANEVAKFFFDFSDVKPGDRFEDTISIRVDDNNAYACMDITLTATDDNFLTEPENDVDQTPGDIAGLGDGELQNGLNFVFWADDGDNVYELGEAIFQQGPASTLFAQDTTRWALADSQNSLLGVSPLVGAQTYYVGKYACYGAITLTPDAQDGFGNVKTPISPNGENTGFGCSGQLVGNEGQTDSVTIDVEFYAVQSRNNGDFLCNQTTP